MCKEKVVVLASGGIDSLVVMRQYALSGKEVYPMYINYGNDNLRPEIETLTNFIQTKDKNICGYQISKCDLELNGSGDSVHYTPVRNLVFLSMAMNYAESIGASTVAIGVINVGRDSFPDCSESFYNDMSYLAFNNFGVRIEMPLKEASKEEVIHLAKCYGLDLTKYFTCEHPNEDGEPCNECSKCLDMKKALEVELNKGYNISSTKPTK